MGERRVEMRRAAKTAARFFALPLFRRVGRLFAGPERTLLLLWLRRGRRLNWPLLLRRLHLPRHLRRRLHVSWLRRRLGRRLHLPRLGRRLHLLLRLWGRPSQLLLLRRWRRRLRRDWPHDRGLLRRRTTRR